MINRARILVSLFCLAAAVGSGAEDPTETYKTLFGDEAKRVAASRDPKVQPEFARKLLDAAKAVAADAPFQALLFNKAFDEGMTSPGGYAVAQEAMEALGVAQPPLKPACDLKVLTALERTYAVSAGAERRIAASAYVDRAFEVGGAQAAAGKWDDAARVYRQAAPAAKAIDADRANDLAHKLKEVTVRQGVARRVEDDKARLRAKPGDAKLATEIVTLTLVELERPADALEFVSATDDATLKALVPLAAKPVAELTEADALRLGNWYAARQSTANRASPLSRSRACYAQFLALHTTKDAQQLKASLELAKVDKALEQLRGPAKADWVSQKATYVVSSENGYHAPLASLLTGDDKLHLGQFAFHTGSEPGAHIVIDLGQERQITGIAIENRRSQAQDRAKGLTVWLGTKAGDRGRKVWSADAVQPSWEFPLDDVRAR
jgi:hypothetical protein